MTRSTLLDRRGLVRFGVAAAILFVCAAALGWGAGDTPVPPLPPVAAARWSLPSPRTEDRQKDLAIVKARRPWSSALAVADRPLAPAQPQVAPPPNWRLVGIVQRGQDSFALISSGPEPAAKLDYLRVGDRLPDGGVVVGLTADTATVDGGKTSAEHRVYRLFGMKQ